jgi:hypothetical protein
MCQLVFAEANHPLARTRCPEASNESTLFNEGASMRKQNHSIPPALKHDTRLINSVIRSRKYKRPNAQKHGVFATPVIIPGEDRDEFQELLAELVDEWKPSGPSLRHALYCLTDSMWRLRRLKKSVQTELYVNIFDSHHPAFDEVWGFAMFIHYLSSEPEKCFDEHARKCLRPGKIDNLKQKFPRTNYQSTSEWAQAVTSEIISVLLPAIPGFKAPEPGARVDDVLEQAAREWRTDQQVVGSIVYARELLEYEFKETERLEARIARQTRHCAELKLWEEARDKNWHCV